MKKCNKTSNQLTYVLYIYVYHVSISMNNYKKRTCIKTLYFIVMFLLSLISIFCELFMYFPTENRICSFGEFRVILLTFPNIHVLIRNILPDTKEYTQGFILKVAIAFYKLSDIFNFLILSLSLSLSPSIHPSLILSNTILFPRIFSFLLRWRALNKTHFLIQSDF